MSSSVLKSKDLAVGFLEKSAPKHEPVPFLSTLRRVFLAALPVWFALLVHALA